jgi:hypothetical protein
MQLKNEIEIIREGMREYTNLTYFIAKYFKCNLATRARLSSVILENGEIDDTGLKILIDNDINDGVGHIGLGVGPTFTIVNI